MGNQLVPDNPFGTACLILRPSNPRLFRISIRRTCDWYSYQRRLHFLLPMRQKNLMARRHGDTVSKERGNASLLLTSFIAPAFAGFGVKESGNSFVVDTDGGLVFTAKPMLIKRTRMVEFRSGQCTMLVDQDRELHQDYLHDQHIDPCTQILRRPIQESCITAEPSVGELRFIARLNANTIPNGHGASKVAGSSSTVEGSDVFVVSGQTRSKCEYSVCSLLKRGLKLLCAVYSSKQFIDDQVHGATGSGIGAYMIIPGTGYESTSGGPFFRDHQHQPYAYVILTQVSCPGGQQEIYYYMNSGHTQTEDYRMGLHGPYLLQFTTGNLAFWDGLGIKGYVPRSGRGFVKGKASGVPSNYAGLVVVGWSNSAAQYWARAEASTGNYFSPAMKPGTYTMTSNELAVAKSTVTISAGQTSTANIQSTEANPSTIWQIGEFDGTPRGFLNADPSDKRMHEWLRTYTVGQQGIGYFPMAIFKAIGPATVRWAMNSSQTGARTLEIGVTLAFAGGRPQVTINGWTGPAPPAPSQPNSRGVTRDCTRQNTLYTVKIPAGVLKSNEVNVMTINVISGSSVGHSLIEFYFYKSHVVFRPGTRMFCDFYLCKCTRGFERIWGGGDAYGQYRTRLAFTFIMSYSGMCIMLAVDK
ncbi:rhamnogalacturonase B [Rhizoctonia solani AG-1 IA]|uniref:rhamnogalacturonan endolyase n=1 Tax=Thanatephorus cucumeris (strain AG1-IA) TaxID=983506 RepID=L8WRF3_THACA|nr:rhamnogalacturonase B [Rhizoctonia solani AG-1 IA]